MTDSTKDKISRINRKNALSRWKGKKRVNKHITARVTHGQWRTLKKIGDGSVGEGIRKLIQFYKDHTK